VAKNKWLTGAIVQVERDRAAGLHGMASDMQKAIDASVEDGRVSEAELLAAGRAAALRLGRRG